MTIGAQPVSKLNPAQTIIINPRDIPWRVPDKAPSDSAAETLGLALAGVGHGNRDAPGAACRS